MLLLKSKPLLELFKKLRLTANKVSQSQSGKSQLKLVDSQNVSLILKNSFKTPRKSSLTLKLEMKLQPLPILKLPLLLSKKLPPTANKLKESIGLRREPTLLRLVDFQNALPILNNSSKMVNKLLLTSSLETLLMLLPKSKPSLELFKRLRPTANKRATKESH